MNVVAVFGSVSSILAAFGGLMLVPALVGIFYGEAVWSTFALCGLGTAALGFIGSWFTPSARNAERARITDREGMAVTALGWAICSILGGLPFLLAGSVPTLGGAAFEAMSGLTTTGATVLTNVEGQTHAVLLWRAFLNWMGGMGIVVLGVALLPGLTGGGSQLFRAEVPGIVNDRLVPRIRETAKRLWGIYIILTAAEIVLLRVFGMSLFDAVTHSLATVATGGFSTASKSVEAWASPAIHIIVLVFMFLGGINFTLHYKALAGDWKFGLRDQELRTYVGIVGVAALVISFDLLRHSIYGLGTTLKNSLFQVVSIMTTTGFTTANYDLWPPLSRFVLLLLMFVGGCAGSTAGSVKVVRFNVLAGHALREMRRAVRPRRVTVLRLNGRAVPEDVISSVMAFVVMYITVFVVSTAILSYMGFDLPSAVGAAACTIGNVGPGFGLVGPAGNFSVLPEAGKWLLWACMLVGRLEVYTVLALFMPGFWRRA
ncbi:MAG: Trk system potassium uptake protein TrkH [Firmicutes bacterium ADurb.Bin506]|nr:MAG: Trk system potassium uptake protein TrkH [Firmicutes bacterium ADurb.Bin506]